MRVPPANGMPGIHHVMSRTVKDPFCRYQTMKGKRVERKGGWDTQWPAHRTQRWKRIGHHQRRHRHQNHSWRIQRSSAGKPWCTKGPVGRHHPAKWATGSTSTTPTSPLETTTSSRYGGCSASCTTKNCCTRVIPSNPIHPLPARAPAPTSSTSRAATAMLPIPHHRCPV